MKRINLAAALGSSVRTTYVGGSFHRGGRQRTPRQPAVGKRGAPAARKSRGVELSWGKERGKVAAAVGTKNEAWCGRGSHDVSGGGRRPRDRRTDVQRYIKTHFEKRLHEGAESVSHYSTF